MEECKVNTYKNVKHEEWGFSGIRPCLFMCDSKHWVTDLASCSLWLLQEKQPWIQRRLKHHQHSRCPFLYIPHCCTTYTSSPSDAFVQHQKIERDQKIFRSERIWENANKRHQRVWSRKHWGFLGIGQHLFMCNSKHQVTDRPRIIALSCYCSPGFNRGVGSIISTVPVGFCILSAVVQLTHQVQPTPLYNTKRSRDCRSLSQITHAKDLTEKINWHFRS